MANVILADMTSPITTTIHLPSGQPEIRKKSAIELNHSDTCTTCKKIRLTLVKAVEMVEEIKDNGALKQSVATCTKHKAPRRLTKKNTRITGVTTRPTDIATGGK